MAKNEHKYINEFVEHYYKLGFDKIYLYDNDDEDKPFIGDYIEKKDFVEIINVRGQKKVNLQHELYTKFYKTHDFEWCLFCDIDEYLVGVNEIHEWLSQKQFKFTNQIRVKWKVFGDDDLIERDTNKPLMESFKKECEWSLTRDLKAKSNVERQGKAFVRGNIEGVAIFSPHYASYEHNKEVIPSVLPSGKMCLSKVAIKEDYSNENVYLYHFMTKTLSEFIEQKLNRNDAVFNVELTMNYFWRINRKTQEKLDYLKERNLL